MCLAYTYVTTILFIAMGSICIYASKNVQSVEVSSSPINLQVVPDWQTTPYVDINLRDLDVGCDSGWETLFTRIFYGIVASCDCLDACDPSSDPSTCYTFNTYVSCTGTQTQSGCK